MSYQGEERRHFSSDEDEVEGLVQRVVRERVPVDKLKLRESDAAKADELRKAVKKKISLLSFYLAGDATEKAAVELTPVTSAGGETAAAKREAQPSHFLSFAESEAFLKKYGIDLGKAREDDVRSMVRYGVLDAKDTDAYGAKFDEVQIPERDLQELVRQLKAEPDLEQRVILGVDSLKPDQVFKKFFVKAGIRHHIFREFYQYQLVDAKTRKPLQNQMPSGKAGILFTPNHINLHPNLPEISPDDLLAKMANGKKYVGPVGWMKLFRQSVDRALPILYPEEAGNLDSLKPEQYKALVQKALLNPRIDEYLLDEKKETVFTDLRFEYDCAVPYLTFNSYVTRREVVLMYCSYPEYPSLSLRGRAALGTFLS